MRPPQLTNKVLVLNTILSSIPAQNTLFRNIPCTKFPCNKSLSLNSLRWGTGGTKRAIDAFVVETGGRGRFIEPSASGTSNPERFISGFPGRTGNMGRFIGTFPTDEEPPLQAHLVNLQNGVAGPQTLLSTHDSHKLNSTHTQKEKSKDVG